MSSGRGEDGNSEQADRLYMRATLHCNHVYGNRTRWQLIVSEVIAKYELYSQNVETKYKQHRAVQQPHRLPPALSVPSAS